jgi:hypothetical protein
MFEEILEAAAVQPRATIRLTSRSEFSDNKVAVTQMNAGAGNQLPHFL